MRRAQAGEPLERREALRHPTLFPAELRNRDSVVNDLGRHDLADLQASLAARMRSELYTSESFQRRVVYGQQDIPSPLRYERLNIDRLPRLRGDRQRHQQTHHAVDVTDGSLLRRLSVGTRVHLDRDV